MIRAECTHDGRIRVIEEYPDGYIESSTLTDAVDARRLAAELIVAADRAERLESDARAPG